MYGLHCKFYKFKIKSVLLFEGNTFANKRSMKHIKSVQNQMHFTLDVPSIHQKYLMKMNFIKSFYDILCFFFSNLLKLKFYSTYCCVQCVHCTYNKFMASYNARENKSVFFRFFFNLDVI